MSAESPSMKQLKLHGGATPLWVSLRVLGYDADETTMRAIKIHMANFLNERLNELQKQIVDAAIMDGGTFGTYMNNSAQGQAFFKAIQLIEAAKIEGPR